MSEIQFSIRSTSVLNIRFFLQPFACKYTFDSIKVACLFFFYTLNRIKKVKYINTFKGDVFMI